MKFKSQICTTRKQSERLLELGLKKETADMSWCNVLTNGNREWLLIPTSNTKAYTEMEIPAWSLGRLIEITLNETWNEVAFERDVNPYEQMIKGIEWLIKEGYFPKEYLV